MTLAGSLKRGLVAGIVAGVLAALFAFVVAEPTLDRAVRLEAARAVSADHVHTAGAAPHSHDAEEAVVSRDLQKRVGAPIGFISVGAALGTIFGMVYAALRRLSSVGDWQRSVALGLAGLTGVVLVPFLRYPPNPPGAGDAGNVDELTRYYLASVLLGVAAVAFAWRLLRLLAARGWPASRRQLAAAGFFVTVVGAGYSALPSPASPSTGDSDTIPASLLWEFRLQSLGTQLLLWAALAVVFGLLTERAARTG